MFYFVKTPWWLKKLYPALTWDMPDKEKNLYLTFDDGPHETATPFVLTQLKQYDAKATFFCIGKNVIQHREIYNQILIEGHKVGNHTNNHLNGWKTKDKFYLENVFEAAKYIDSNLFRPPYGRITKFQAKILSATAKPFATQYSSFKIIMWDVLSGDFDAGISPEKCYKNVRLNAKNGSIIVFHDSLKAYEKMSYALPKLLDYYSEQGFKFESLSM